MRRLPLRRTAGSKSRGPYDVAFYVPWVSSLIAPGGGPPPGGAESQAYLLARALAARGSRVCMVAYDTPGGLPSHVDGIDIVRRPPPLWTRRPRLWGRSAEVATVWRDVTGLDAAVFVQRGTHPQTGLVALAAKAKRRRFVYSSASLVDFDWGRVAARRNVFLFKLGVRLADAIVVQTPEQERLCRERFGRNAVMIRSIAEPFDGGTRRPEAFLWVGKFAFYKRPLAFLELARAVPNARFWIVGAPAEKHSADVAEQVERTAAEIPNVELLPARPRPGLMRLIENSVAVVGTGDYEGMPNVFLEAWARGVPALALNHDPDGVIEREDLGGFAHGSPERLAELALELWRSRDDRQALAARCRAYVRREHGLDAVVGRWIEALDLDDAGRRRRGGRGS